ncbi:DJ-1/PfpI family protein [Streptacidiphilus fuscans]|uniref:DJ-1/PfpI family protein n=1 Tax=Streptacidiphilus fuscans TaxID=2789292 RepID=A0A931B841_9ACTN|nr:DJ-1/PfpI family protein [Streptacidiphilus fuscans]MBF9070771.1 DJ-1/PfpI family protein [Streptacidiphilus fuscans]
MTDIKTIGVLAYHRCSESDTIIPWEILTGVAVYLKNTTGEQLDVKLVALDEGSIEMQMGARVEPHAVLKNGDLYDVLYVPGGNGSGEATKDERVLDTIRHHYVNGKFIGSNCVGVGILQRAGVLGNTPVTCSPPITRRLKEEGANVVEPRRMWLGAPDQRIWTTAGASSINAGTVAMVNYLFGEEIGREMSMWFDTLGAVGADLFKNDGPEYYAYPEAEAALQDATADVLLPPLR